MALNYWAILLVTILTFIGAAIWHGPIFGKLWMKIHHGDKKISKDEEKKMMKGMWKLLLTEFIVTFLMINTLAFVIEIIPEFSGIHIAFMMWVGFVVPMSVSNVIWGGDKKEWMISKILIIISFRFIALLSAGYFLGIGM